MLENGNKAQYERGKLTLGMVEEAISKLIIPREPRTTVIYTDNLGYNIMQFAPHMGHIKWWFTTFKHAPGFAYISIGKKHGLFKVKMFLDGRKYKYQVYHGTTLVGTCNTVESVLSLYK